MVTHSRGYRPAPLASLGWRFLPAADLVELRGPSHPPVDPPHVPGLDLEAQYAVFLEQARRERLANPPAPGSGWADSPQASLFAAPQAGLDRASLDADAGVDFALAREGGAGAASMPERAGSHLLAPAHDDATAGGAGVQEEAERAGETALHLPSPAIIWRPAAPVRLASNIPSELLPKAPPKDPEHLRALQLADSQHTRRRAPPPRPKQVPNTWNRPQSKALAKPATSTHLPFGAWYLPNEAWGKLAPPHDSEAAAELAHIRDPSVILADGDPAADLAAAGITSKLSTLYSSRMYKDYLRQHGARVPSFLQRVETPKAGQRRTGAGVSSASSDAGQYQR
ncbi:hypothetical protein T492DRAFT_909672 [Pavlovales sp. CCMP2436]|nr:hypothetical protein T492DRAFT_909672 [Pavlovales sp. CCMP2436]